jgi:hypothetical protein
MIGCFISVNGVIIRPITPGNLQFAISQPPRFWKLIANST